MNTTTEHDRNLAEKLRSLSLRPRAFEPESPKPRARRFPIRLGAIALVTVAAIYALVVYQAGVLDRTGFGRGAAAEGPTNADLGTCSTSAGADKTAALSSNIPITRDVTGSGYVVAPDLAAVFSKYEGKIIEVAVDLGDKVETGQVLVRLDDAGAGFKLREAEIAQASAALTLAAKNVDLEQTNSSLDRIRILAARSTASKQQLEDAEAVRERAANAMLQAGQDLAKAKLDLEEAEERVSELTIRAPISGAVSMLNARTGESVLARADNVREDTSLLTIANTMNLVIDADVAESGIGLIRPGLRGEAVLDGFPDQPFEVEVSRIAPAASAEKGTVALRLSLVSPPAGIRPNMAARINIAASATVAATYQRGMEK